MLMEEYNILKERFATVNNTYSKQEEAFKWLQVFQRPTIYKGIEKILHFALCSFLKSPLEATAETLGSTINHHGTKIRKSLHADTLSTEVQVAWNGPGEFSPEAQDLIKEAVESYFKDVKYGVRFYIKSSLKLVSSTVHSYITKPSRIKF